MVSSLESTDKVIADLDAAFAVLSQKLLGVQSDMQYRAITGTGGFNDPQLTGETKSTVARAVAIVSGIWVVSNLVGQRLTEVKAKRASIKTGFFSIGSGGKDLEDQLRLHNLALGAGVTDKLPVELKQLLCTEHDGITSVELALQVGSDQLKVGARAIIEVDDCMNALMAQIADTETKLAEVLPVVTKIGGSALLAHRNAVGNLTSAKASYQFDPLGVRKTFEKNVGQHITAINVALDGVQRAKEKAYSELGDAKVLMQRLEDRQPSPAKTPELRDWLAKLAARLDQEEWATASQGLDDWIKEASAALSIKPPAPSYQPRPPVNQAPPLVPHGQTAFPGGPAHTQPSYPSYPQQPSSPRVQQVPTTDDYRKYQTREKTNLEKLLDGEMAASSSAPAPAADKPVDPALEKLVSAQTPASVPTATTTAPNAAVDALVNGPGKPAASQPATQTRVEPASNAALDALVNGRPGSTASTAPASNPGAKPSAATVSDTNASAVERLVNGQSKPVQSGPPASSNTGQSNGSLTDLIEGKKPTRPTNPPTASTTISAPTTSGVGVSTPVSKPVGNDSSRLEELLGEKKKPQPAPTTAPVKAGATATDAAKPATVLSQAEQDAAARKALENLLKG